MLAVLAVTSCKKNVEGDVVKALNVVVSPSTASVIRGETLTLSAVVSPSNVADGSVVWSSLNPEMAIVDGKGLVKTLRPGVTYIVATSADGNAKGSCRLTINYPDRYYLVLQDESGEDLPPCVYGYPGLKSRFKVESSDAVAHTYSWSSDNSQAASVDEHGLVTFNTPGNGADGYIYYASSIIKVESEDTFSDRVEVVSNVRSVYSFGGGVRDFDEDYGVSGGKTYAISLLWNDGRSDRPLPAGLYDVISSDNSVLSVSKQEDGFVVTTTAQVGAAARLGVKLWNDVELILGRYTISDAVDGTFPDYTEVIR